MCWYKIIYTCMLFIVSKSKLALNLYSLCLFVDFPFFCPFDSVLSPDNSLEKSLQFSWQHFGSNLQMLPL